MLNHHTKISQENFQRHVLAKAHVKLSSFDTVTTQEGNIYDFGSYHNYNLGKRYVENHMHQHAVLNEKTDYDLLDKGGQIGQKSYGQPVKQVRLSTTMPCRCLLGEQVLLLMN
jgi:hypothetical protein